MRAALRHLLGRPEARPECWQYGRLPDGRWVLQDRGASGLPPAEWVFASRRQAILAANWMENPTARLSAYQARTGADRSRVLVGAYRPRRWRRVPSL